MDRYIPKIVVQLSSPVWVAVSIADIVFGSDFIN